MKLITLPLLVVSCFAGCHYQNATDSPRFLDDYLEYPIGYRVDHNTFVVYPRLRPDADSRTMKRDITAFLTGSTKIQGKFPSDEAGSSQLRPRDFWGLVLARLSERPLEINVVDSPKERDEKISRLLHEVGDR